jgi:hypothetical protein
MLAHEFPMISTSPSLPFALFRNGTVHVYLLSSVCAFLP